MVEPRPRPAEAQKPDDPQLEAAFRMILRPSGTPNEEVDAQLAESRKYVEGKPDLIKQLRGAAVLGIYLIEESSAGRLKVPYGSPYVLQRLRELLRELGGSQEAAPAPAMPSRRAGRSLDGLPHRACSATGRCGATARTIPEMDCTQSITA